MSNGKMQEMPGEKMQRFRLGGTRRRKESKGPKVSAKSKETVRSVSALAQKFAVRRKDQSKNVMRHESPEAKKK